MSDDMATVAAGGDDGPQPASGPMDQAVAEWYVEFTGGQFAAFERDGHWYLYTPDKPEVSKPAGMPVDE